MLSAFFRNMRLRRSKKLSIVFGLMSLLVSLIACTTIRQPTLKPLPTIASHTQPSPTRPHLLIQYCDDDTGSYRTGKAPDYFLEANKLIAASLQDAVTANQDGVTLYATAVTRDTFNPVNTLDPALLIPPVPAYQTPPTPMPTHAPDNPVYDPATATAVQAETINDITAYNQSVATIDQTLDAAKSAMGSDVKRLTKWNPPVDHIATSVLGCFQLAAARFQGQPGAKMLYIASDLENNTDVDRTQNFVSSHALAGVTVHVIFFFSANAKRDADKRSLWCPYLKDAGASTVLFSEPVTPLQDIFDADLASPTSAC